METLLSSVLTCLLDEVLSVLVLGTAKGGERKHYKYGLQVILKNWSPHSWKDIFFRPSKCTAFNKWDKIFQIFHWHIHFFLPSIQVLLISRSYMKVEQQHLSSINMFHLLRRLHLVKVEHFKLIKSLVVNIVYYPWQSRSMDKHLESIHFD